MPSPLSACREPPTRVLVVEDSPTARALLVHILGSDPEIQVVGEARDGVEGVELTRKLMLAAARPQLEPAQDRPHRQGASGLGETLLEAATHRLGGEHQVTTERFHLPSKA